MPRAAAGACESAAETGRGEIAGGHAGAERGEPRGAAGDAHVDAVQGCHGPPVGGDGLAVAETAPADRQAVQAGAGDNVGADGETGEAQLVARLTAAGVAGHVAADVVARYPRRRIEEALAVAAVRPSRNTGGWIVTVLRDGWDLSDRLADVDHADAQSPQVQAHHAQAARNQAERAVRAEADDADRQQAQDWSQAVSAALDDDQLTAAVALVTKPVASVGRRSVPVAHNQLVTWAALVADRLWDRPLAAALSGALEQGLDLGEEVAAGPSLPDPPPVEQPSPAELRRRLTALLNVESSHEPASKGA
jgi:hypothetical protein